MIKVMVDSDKKRASVDIDGKGISLIAELGAVVKIVLHEMLDCIDKSVHDDVADAVRRAVELAIKCELEERGADGRMGQGQERRMIADMLADFVDAPDEAVEEMATEIMMNLREVREKR